MGNLFFESSLVAETKIKAELKLGYYFLRVPWMNAIALSGLNIPYSFRNIKNRLLFFIDSVKRKFALKNTDIIFRFYIITPYI